jgi:hypothetical protein
MRQLVVWPNDGGTILLEVHETASITGQVIPDLCGGQETERARQIHCRRRATSNPRPGDHHAAVVTWCP